MQHLTLEEIEAMPAEVLTPVQVASVLHLDQQAIRIAARERPDLLGFPVVCVGTRVKIPKKSFVKFMRGEL